MCPCGTRTLAPRVALGGGGDAADSRAWAERGEGATPTVFVHPQTHSPPRATPPSDFTPADDASGSDLKLPLAGADTDWREFRARLVSGASAGAATRPAADAADADAPAPGTSSGWAHPLTAPEAGAVLIAHPLLFTTSQTYFHQSVVLLISHGPDGSAGLILNKPSQYTLADVGGVDALLPACGGCTLYLGGDVERASVHVVHALPSLPGAVQVVPGVCVGGVEAAAAATASGAAPADAFQWLSGYCGWSPGQLASEVEAGVWTVAAADAATLLSASRPGGPRGGALWHALLERIGGDHAALSAATRGGVDDRIMRLVRGEKQKEEGEGEGGYGSDVEGGGGGGGDETRA